MNELTKIIVIVKVTMDAITMLSYIKLDSIPSCQTGH